MTTIKPYSILFIALCSILISFDWVRLTPPDVNVTGNWTLSHFYPTTKDTFQFKETIFLTIEKDGTTSGFLGCNKFRARCKTIRDSISFGTFLSSRKFCQRSVMDLEDKTKEVLLSANVYSIKDNMLILYRNKEKLALLKKH